MTLDQAIQSIREDESITKEDFVDALERAYETGNTEFTLEQFTTQVAVSMLIRTKKICRDENGDLVTLRG